MPKISVDEHGKPQLMEREIGCTEDRTHISAEANAHGAECDRKSLLRLRSSRSDGAHDRPSLDAIENVAHGIGLI